MKGVKDLSKVVRVSLFGFLIGFLFFSGPGLGSSPIWSATECCG